jgi:GNAT superfamily N-acetyltransferase
VITPLALLRVVARPRDLWYTTPMSSSTPPTSPATTWPLRLARESDVPAIEALISLSVYTLQAPFYSKAQMDAALGPVFGVDRQLIRDGSYFVTEQDGAIVGCGGWSRRRSLYGGDTGRAGEDGLLDPRSDAARVRAFFVHPSWARRGIGRAIMVACEQAIEQAGFRAVDIVATLAGEPLYATFGYAVVERYGIPLAGGLKLPVVRMTKKIERL